MYQEPLKFLFVSVLFIFYDSMVFTSLFYVTREVHRFL